MTKEVKKTNKPYQIRAKMGFAPVLLGKYKTKDEAERAIPGFEAKRFYQDVHVHVEETEVKNSEVRQ